MSQCSKIAVALSQSTMEVLRESSAIVGEKLKEYSYLKKMEQ